MNDWPICDNCKTEEAWAAIKITPTEILRLCPKCYRNWDDRKLFGEMEGDLFKEEAHGG